MNERALVEGLRRQDPAAVRFLSECCLPSVWRFVYARVRGDQHLAEDIVSEAVLALLRTAADPTAEIGNPMSWLRTVVANKVADHFRAAARVQHLINQVKHETTDVEMHDAQASHQLLERREEVRNVLGQMTEQSRLALEWKYVDKLSVREIAVRFSVTEKAAESILFRARGEFRQKMMMKDQESPQSCNSPTCGGLDGGHTVCQHNNNTVCQHNDNAVCQHNADAGCQNNNSAECRKKEKERQARVG